MRIARAYYMLLGPSFWMSVVGIVAMVALYAWAVGWLTGGGLVVFAGVLLFALVGIVFGRAAVSARRSPRAVARRAILREAKRSGRSR